MSRLDRWPPAYRVADIDAALARALDTGAIEPRTLAEWVAVDQAMLAEVVAGELRLDGRHLARRLAPRRGESVMVRLRATAEALREQEPRLDVLLPRLLRHRLPMVREWAAYAIEADDTLELPERLALLRPLAQDESAPVRESAWIGFRKHIAGDLDRALALLEQWAADDDENVRRCAVEGTRPRGVWCAHIRELRSRPEKGEALLELVRDDPSDYVRRAAANWINDASKDRPDWAQALTRRWLDESPSPATHKLVLHALRTLRRQADARR